MGRIARRGLLAAALISLLIAPVAQAQQYEDEVGNLDLDVTVTVTVVLSGEGFVGDSVVYVTLTSSDGEEVIDLGTIPTDEQGTFVGEITLPNDVEPGSYTIAATGVTSQGATRVLSAPVGVGQELAISLEPASTTTSTTTTPTVDVTTTYRADRGDGLDPIEVTATPPTPNDRPADRVVLTRVLAGGLFALGGAWWWLYKAAKG